MIVTARLVLEPLRVEHADEVASALDDPALHTYTGGRPATARELRRRFEVQCRGRSGDGTEIWHNWIARHRATGEIVGTVQATITEADGRSVSDIAWVIATRHQRQGYASEAAAAMVAWLRDHGVDELAANIHPEHDASMGVARRLGLTPTDTVVDGEIRWTGNSS